MAASELLVRLTVKVKAGRIVRMEAPGEIKKKANMKMDTKLCTW